MVIAGLILAAIFLLFLASVAVHEVHLARSRRRRREQPATLEGAGSHLSTRP